MQTSQLSASVSPNEDAGWKRLEVLPCTVSIEVPVSGFTLRQLLELKAGSVVGSQHSTTSNLPLRVNGELVAWCEFEVVGSRLSVGLTELA